MESVKFFINFSYDFGFFINNIEVSNIYHIFNVFIHYFNLV